MSEAYIPLANYNPADYLQSPASIKAFIDDFRDEGDAGSVQYALAVASEALGRLTAAGEGQ